MSHQHPAQSILTFKNRLLLLGDACEVWTKVTWIEVSFDAWRARLAPRCLSALAQSPGACLHTWSHFSGTERKWQQHCLSHADAGQTLLVGYKTCRTHIIAAGPKTDWKPSHGPRVWLEVWTKGLDGGLGRKLGGNSLGSDDGMAGDSESLLYTREPCLEAPLVERWCRSHL